MRFAEPHMFTLLLLLPVIAAVLWWLMRRRLKKLASFIDAALLDSVWLGEARQRYVVASVLLLVFFTVTVIALARPQWGKTEQQIKRRGVDILLAVDVSKSMLTRDVSPDRLGRVKLAAKDLLKALKGDRVGLMAFAGDAFLMCPLTSDYAGFTLSLDDLSTDSVPLGGTNIARAIDEAVKIFDQSKNPQRVMVLITDGDELEGDATAAARRAKAKGVKIYTVGMGTREGDLIKVQDQTGSWVYLKDAQGQVVKSRLNEKLLQEVAFITGGAYARSSGAQFGLDFLYRQQLSRLDKRDYQAQTAVRYHERFQWPLTVALLLFIAQTVIINRRRA